MKHILYLTISILFLCNQNIKSQTIDTLITAGNQRLHFNIIKGKNPPILFESGNGNDGSVWKDVLPQISKATGATLITYDRAGLGQSEIDTLTINYKDEIKNLESALKQLGYYENLFIVNHSFGGFYTTLFTVRNKDKVKGSVYIDPALSCFTTKEWSKDFVDHISQENWALIKKHKIGLYYVLLQLEEIADYMSTIDLPKELPVTLIAAEKVLPMVKQHEIHKWQECMKSFGTLPNHKYVLAKNCGHKVWLDDEKLVIDEIVKGYQKVHFKESK
ncbi:alpha/beta fold hydrolase [Aquimarina algicola]|uniref:Alpha/beta hydrolase n=1 Tax=Aquimarina algicola TaxID=2589995 RepID=A0A504IWB2_9FLAO|nr:alpha/beta hydrolase [Aquimarina algicola]TPN82314.1 alpha/beta hydrolase [Aquimarina algicola]